MALVLYNSLSRKKETFEPIKPGSVLMYHCGPTVYWTQHIGNLRAMVMADLVVRTFKYLNFEIKLVRNYTDVGHLTSDADEGEDKIEKRAKEEKLLPKEIAEKYIKIFEHDTQELNTLSPNEKPLATKNIQEMTEMIKVLVEKGFAYLTDLAIYFDVSKAKNYNKLSGQKIQEQIEGAGKAAVRDPNKKHPSDFALWFFKAGKHKNALQYWKSPFFSSLVKNGEGFPGWHIECSALAKKYLADTIDIHMGGVEHIPIHHTNEITQSESANGVKFANYWLHNEHLTADGKKMSKSEGTGYSLSEVEKKGFTPLAIRYFFLQAHYRSKQNFTWEGVRAAQNGLKHLQNQIRKLGSIKGEIDEGLKKEFIEKISDDFNIPQALAVLQKLLRSNLSNKSKLATALNFDKVLGLKLNLSAPIKTNEIKIPKEVQKLADEREKAREEKNWQKADQIRQEMKSLGWIVEDKSEGSTLKKR